MSNPVYDLSIRTIAAATEELPRHSEASILELKDHRLLIAWQRHEKSGFGSGDQAPSTISLMNSDDSGVTWHNFRVAAGMIPGCVNVYSESEYSTVVVLNGCTRINCGTRKYGPNSTLTIK